MPEETNPILKNADAALDVIEDFVADKFTGVPLMVAENLLRALRDFLQLPDNYGGDPD